MAINIIIRVRQLELALAKLIDSSHEALHAWNKTNLEDDVEFSDTMQSLKINTDAAEKALHRNP